MDLLFDVEGVISRKVVARFNGGRISSDGGGLLLTQVDQKLGLCAAVASCFRDHRKPELVEHQVGELVRQRIFALALGYEDLNDHDELRRDPLFATMVGKDDPLGSKRKARDMGMSLAGKSTLNRLELSRSNCPKQADKVADQSKKLPANLHGLQDLLVDLYLRQHATPPREVTLDLDATDAPLHGMQLGRFFHGFYGAYCYLPLCIFAGEHPLLALLRPANIDASHGLIKHLERIVSKLRAAWPSTPIIIRGDSGFCRESLLRWCEEHHVGYIIGMAQNQRLNKAIGKPLHAAKQAHQAEIQAKKERGERSPTAARIFADLDYRTQRSWSRSRRVVAKAEQLDKGPNPRFVVTSLTANECAAQTLYEERYCARGEMENRIKEQQLYLFANRVSCRTMRANQLRLLFAVFAQVMIRALREVGLADTPMSAARADTIRLKLFKIGALVTVTVRNIWIQFSEAFPRRDLFAKVYQSLANWQLPMPPATSASTSALPTARSLITSALPTATSSMSDEASNQNLKLDTG